MQKSVAYVGSIPFFVAPGFARSGSAPSGTIRGDVYTKGTNGKLAVLTGVLIILRGPITRETESDAKGAFAIDGSPPGTYQIEANAPGFYAAVAVNGVPVIQRKGRSVLSVWDQNRESADKICELLNSFEDEPEVFLTEDYRKWLKAMDCAFGRRVHHA